MKKVVLAVLAICAVSCSSPVKYGSLVTIPDDVLMDKIRGGWFGQTIGCTYGGPTEFKYKGSIINEEIPIPWYDDYIYDTFIEDPGLYDDVYMDLTFVDVMAAEGLDAPAEAYARAFAHADYKLWHANQEARYNILRGIMPPESGHWMNNPHADDIDFQIEADFIGMITPGMPVKGCEFADRIGHIMNYGDGWYGGVFVGAMYSLAFVCDDIPLVVREALRTIPEGTKFHRVISDVLKFWKKYPSDWKQTWFEIQKLHNNEVGCPEGVWNGFNIDAAMNAAHIVIGLLYGEGDFGRTMEISTRCGDDSDCNPASAAGILGVMYGYDAIPSQWKGGVDKIADMPFPYTTLSLNRLCDLNLELIHKVAGGNSFLLEQPRAVRYEQSFEGLVPVEKRVLKKSFTDSLTLEFDGNSVVVEGSVQNVNSSDFPYVASVTAILDGETVETFDMPVDYIIRKYEVFSKYCFGSGHHTLKFILNNPHPDFSIWAQQMTVYDKKD
ncbi:MAG: ADP-ribosylglycohydrolase family protein [Bacteroidales bacterium]|nr:ADP-ribosylglycohydrolase family protein [Bacteroidales bacterium]